MSVRAESAIIGISAAGGEGLSYLREISGAISEIAPIVAISCVYRVEGVTSEPQHVHDLRATTQFEALNFCIQAHAPQGPRVLLKQLRQIEGRINSQSMRRGARLMLFFYGELNQMTPELTLPFHGFHLRPDYVFPAAEIWPEYVHPVLKRTLRDMAQEMKHVSWGEFFCQGKTVLDF